MYKIKRGEKISLKDAKSIILQNLEHSNYDSIRAIKKYGVKTNENQLTKFYDRNKEISLSKIASKGTDYNHRFDLENLLDFNPMSTLSKPGMMGITKTINGIDYPIEIPKNAHVVAMVSYEAIFADSYNAFEKSIQETSISDFITAVNKGISSIENSIRDAADGYNLVNEEKLKDDKFHKITFDGKIDEWIPIISGKKFDKGDRVWQSYKILNKFRDDKDQHFKGGYGFNWDEIVELKNLYKFGIAQFLFRLDRIFSRRTSSLVIRAQYYPKISLEIT